MLDQCLALYKFRVDVLKAEVLRDYSRRGKLDEGNIYLILNGELGRRPSKKRNPTIKLKRDVYNKFFPPGWSAAEVPGLR